MTETKATYATVWIGGSEYQYDERSGRWLRLKATPQDWADFWAIFAKREPQPGPQGFGATSARAFRERHISAEGARWLEALMRGELPQPQPDPLRAWCERYVLPAFQREFLSWTLDRAAMDEFVGIWDATRPEQAEAEACSLCRGEEAIWARSETSISQSYRVICPLCRGLGTGQPQ